MKTITKLAALCSLSLFLGSCGGSSSSTGCFGDIPETVAKYEQESEEMASKMTQGNYSEIQEKIDGLKAETKTKVQEEAKALNGKEINATTDEAVLKIEQPLTLVFRNLNGIRAMFGLEGKVVAAKDLTLNATPSDLQAETLLSGSKITVSVKKLIDIELLDKDGNVVDTRKGFGYLVAENLGTSAVVKAGTPVVFQDDVFVAGEDQVGVESIRLVCDLSKAPYFSRNLE